MQISFWKLMAESILKYPTFIRAQHVHTVQYHLPCYIELLFRRRLLLNGKYFSFI